MDGVSHEGTRCKVKAGHIHQLRCQASQRRTIRRIWTVRAVTLDLEHYCKLTPETPVLERFHSRVIDQHKVMPTFFEWVGFAFLIATTSVLLLPGLAAGFGGSRCILAVFVIPRVSELAANNERLFDLVLITIVMVFNSLYWSKHEYK